MSTIDKNAICFLFADKKDFFLTDGLIKLNYKKYFYYYFHKEKGCKHVFYLNKEFNETRISCVSDKDEKYLNDNAVLTGFWDKKMDVEMTVGKILKRKEKSVFIVEPECFRWPFSNINGMNGILAISLPADYSGVISDNFRNLLGIGDDTQISREALLSQSYNVIPDDNFDKDQKTKTKKREDLFDYLDKCTRGKK